jgi:hypothetical protein
MKSGNSKIKSREFENKVREPENRYGADVIEMRINDFQIKCLSPDVEHWQTSQARLKATLK